MRCVVDRCGPSEIRNAHAKSCNVYYAWEIIRTFLFICKYVDSSIKVSIYLPMYHYLPIYPSVDLSIHEPLYPTTYLKVYLDIYRPILPPVYLCECVYPSNRPSFYQSGCLPIKLSTYLSFYHYLSMCLSVYLPIYLSVLLPIQA